MKTYRHILNFLTNKNGSGFLKYAVKFPLVLLSFITVLFSKIKRGIGNIAAKDPGLFVISFGNINMGGTGKTPFSSALAEYLYGKQLKPCIITRGYNGRLKKKPI
jgi:tetraacyldisaccharide 4'-kinase